MSKIESSLTSFFNQYPERPIVVAYSGGVDSQVLLSALSTLKQCGAIQQIITVCHVNHGLSRNASIWQQQATDYCKSLALPLTVCEVAVKEVKGESLESLAREARYKALKETSDTNAIIVTGHHSDDQAETFLLALKRGAGIKGLSSMVEVMPFTLHNTQAQYSDEQLLARPLLSFTRKSIEDYATSHQLHWVEDESNENLRFDRNFIRHEVMPTLSQRWPSILSTIKRSTELCQEGQILLNELGQKDLAECELNKSVLSIDKLQLLSQARFNNLLRYFLETHGSLMPSKQQLEQVYNQLSAAQDKSPEVKIGDYWLRRYQRGLHLTLDYKDISSWEYHIDVKSLISQSQQVNLPEHVGCLVATAVTCEDNALQTSNAPCVNQWLRLPESHEKLTIKFVHNNPKCLPDYRQHSRELKKILQELKLAPWERKRIAFIYYNDQLAAALGLFTCKEFVAKKGELALSLCLNSCNYD